MAGEIDRVYCIESVSGWHGGEVQWQLLKQDGSRPFCYLDKDEARNQAGRIAGGVRVVPYVREAELIEVAKNAGVGRRVQGGHVISQKWMSEGGTDEW